MEYRPRLGYIFIVLTIIHLQLILTITTIQIKTLSTQDLLQSIPTSLNKINWETGLREAMYQALLREHYGEGRLKTKIYDAPILGYQDSATPFGDIAVLARGQFYNTVLGYQFVQDLYQNDCDDCHNQPDLFPNEPRIVTQNRNKQLIALWTVKRIRHRDNKTGHRFELQFTISPISPVTSIEFITRNGNIDYNVPGHVFIVKLWNTESNAYTQDRNKYDQKESSGSSNMEYKQNPQRPLQTLPVHHPNYHNREPASLIQDEYYSSKEKNQYLNPRYLIGISQNGYKHVIPDIPATVSSHHTSFHKHHHVTHYKQPIRHYHHHYYIPKDDEYDHRVRPIPPTMVQDEHFPPDVPGTVLSEVPHHQVTFTTQGYPTFDHPPTPIYTVPHTHKAPQTTFTSKPAYFQPTLNTGTTRLPSGNTMYQTPSSPEIPFTKPIPMNPSPPYVQYSEPDPSFPNNEPPTVTMPMTTHSTARPRPTPPRRRPPIRRPATKRPMETEKPVELDDIFGKPMTSSEPPRKANSMKYPDSINAQLPPPDQGTDVTIPYVETTIVTRYSTMRPTTMYQNTSSEDTKVMITESPRVTGQTIRFPTTLDGDGHTKITTQSFSTSSNRDAQTSSIGTQVSHKESSVETSSPLTSTEPSDKTKQTTLSMSNQFTDSDANTNTFVAESSTAKPNMVSTKTTTRTSTLSIRPTKPTKLTKPAHQPADSEEDVNVFGTDVSVKKSKVIPYRGTSIKSPNIYFTPTAIINRLRRPNQKVPSQIPDSEEDVDVFETKATTNKTKPNKATTVKTTNQRRPILKQPIRIDDSEEEDVNVFDTETPSTKVKHTPSRTTEVKSTISTHKPVLSSISKLSGQFPDSDEEDVNVFDTDAPITQSGIYDQTRINITTTIVMQNKIIKTTPLSETEPEEDVNVFEDKNPTTEDEIVTEKIKMTMRSTYIPSLKIKDAINAPSTAGTPITTIKEVYSTSGYLPPSTQSKFSTNRTSKYTPVTTNTRRTSSFLSRQKPSLKNKSETTAEPSTLVLATGKTKDTTSATTQAQTSSAVTQKTTAPSTKQPLYTTQDTEQNTEENESSVLVTVPPTDHFLPSNNYNSETERPAVILTNCKMDTGHPQATLTTSREPKLITRTHSLPAESEDRTMSNNVDRTSQTNAPTSHRITENVSKFHSFVESGTIDDDGRLPIENEGIFKKIKIPRTKPHQNKNTDSSDIDIFGEPKRNPGRATEISKRFNNKKQNNYDDIFSNFNTKNSNSRTSNTSNSPNARLSKYLRFRKVNRRNKPFTNEENGTSKNESTTNTPADRTETKTSQSLITSISFKVNRNNDRPETSTIPISGTKNKKLKHALENNEQAEALNDFAAQSLVNHANAATYLNSRTRPVRRRYRPTRRPS